MSAESDILQSIDAAFGSAPRPEHFTNFSHCCECAEHDQTLLALKREDLPFEQLGNPGWDPICFVNVQGYLHLMPGLARLALRQGEESYLGQFLFHLNPDRINAFDRAQKEAVLRLLTFIRDSMHEEVEANLESEVLERRIARLRTFLS